MFQYVSISMADKFTINEYGSRFLYRPGWRPIVWNPTDETENHITLAVLLDHLKHCLKKSDVITTNGWIEEKHFCKKHGLKVDFIPHEFEDYVHNIKKLHASLHH